MVRLAALGLGFEWECCDLLSLVLRENLSRREIVIHDWG